MVAKTGTSKTSQELSEIAVEMLLELENRHHLTNCETALVLFLMQDAEHYSQEVSHIKRIMKND